MPTVITTRTFTRPSVDVAWHHEQNDNSVFLQSLFSNFVNTNKILDRIVLTSSDGLTMTVTIEWDSEESMNEHYNDSYSVEHFANRDAYNTANGITTTFTII